MENAVEALKMAFSVMMFVLALTLSVSSFSKANSAVTAITNMRDRETHYTYVEPTGKNRIVGMETVIPTMYRAYIEHFEIRFYEQQADGTIKELPIYYETDYQNPKYGDIQYDGPNKKTINYVDLEKESFGTEINQTTGGTIPAEQVAIKHLDIILDKKPIDSKAAYYKQFYYDQGFYEKFKDRKLEEKLGEYYLTTAETADSNKTKKRVITYILQPE